MEDSNHSTVPKQTIEDVPINQLTTYLTFQEAIENIEANGFFLGRIVASKYDTDYDSEAESDEEEKGTANGISRITFPLQK